MCILPQRKKLNSGAIRSVFISCAKTNYSLLMKGKLPFSKHTGHALFHYRVFLQSHVFVSCFHRSHAMVKEHNHFQKFRHEIATNIPSPVFVDCNSGDKNYLPCLRSQLISDSHSNGTLFVRIPLENYSIRFEMDIIRS